MARISVPLCDPLPQCPPTGSNQMDVCSDRFRFGFVKVQDFGEDSALFASDKPLEAKREVVCPDIVGNRRYRLENLDQGLILRPRKQP